MKTSTIIAALAALSLAACQSGKPEGTSEATAEASAETTPAAPAAAESAGSPAAGGVPSKDFIVGKWGDNGDCELAIEFKADGSMVGPFEKWELDDKGVLTMVGNPQKMHLKVVDQDNMESRLNGTGEPHRINRCK